jgi:hypothetical protein
MKVLCAAAVLFALLCSHALSAQSTDPAQPAHDDASLKPVLVAQVNAFMQAWQRQDAAALTATMAPDFRYVSSQGVAPREGVVAALTHACTLSSYSLSDVQLVTISSDSAVLIYKIHQSASCAGHPDPPVVLNTDTLIRRGGRWVFLLTTSTPAE